MTDRVVLRGMTKADLERVRTWGNDSEVATFIDRVRPISEVEHEKWFEKMVQDPNVYLFAIDEKENRQHIGNVWLCNLDSRHRRAEIRVMIGDRNYWGKGFGREAVSAAVHFGFEKLNLHKIYAYVLSNNPRSKGMFEACGFIVEGNLKEEYFADGSYIDGCRLGIIRKE